MIKNLLKISLLIIPFWGNSQIFQENWDGNGPGLTAWTVIDSDGLTVDSSLSTIFPTAWSILNNTNITTLTSNVAASTSWYNPAGSANDWLISPTIAVSGTSPTLYWSAKAQDPDYPDGYKVMLSPNGGNTIADFTVTLFETSAETPNWTNRHGDLTPYIGQNVRIAFVNQSHDQYIILIDDIKVETTFTPPPPSYCGPLFFGLSIFGFNIDGDEPITLMNFANINNVQPSTLNTGNSHLYFTNMTANVVAGQTYTMTIQGNTGGAYDSNLVAFFDWNQNGILNDPGEVYEFLVPLSNSTGEDGQQITHNITVPANAVVGDTRMRVKKMYGNTGLADPCLGGEYGQAQDYTINIASILTTTETEMNRNKISIYPNPSADIVHIQSDDKIKSISVFDTAGRKMQLDTKNIKENKLNISNLNTGIYILKIETDKTTKSIKLHKK